MAANTNENPSLQINISGTEGANQVAATIPAASLQAIVAGNVSELSLVSSVATLTFDSGALNSITNAAGADVTFTAALADSSSLSAAARQIIGDRPVYQFSVTSGGENISQFNGNVTVSLPYTPAAGEDTNAIIITYLNANGNLEIVTNGHYNPATQSVEFSTNHFSKYAVGYNKINFTDVKSTDWYAEAVAYMAAREISSGTGENTFSPNKNLTRGEFLTLLMRAYDIKAASNTEDNFSDAGNTYYTAYLARAKQLGISQGIGANKYAPEQAISRQDMFTLLYKTLGSINKLPAANNSKTLSGFSDHDAIAPYATDAMNRLIKAGTINGSNGKLTPNATTSRAEMTQVLYSLLAE